MAVQEQDDQHEHTFSSYVRIRDVVLKTCLGRWTIGRSGERGSGISVLSAWHDDDDDISINMIWHYLTYNGWYAIKPSQPINQICCINWTIPICYWLSAFCLNSTSRVTLLFTSIFMFILPFTHPTAILPNTMNKTFKSRLSNISMIIEQTISKWPATLFIVLRKLTNKVRYNYT